MGTCFSKKKQSPSPPHPISEEPSIQKKAEKKEEKKKRETTTTSQEVAAEAVVEKEQVFVITQNLKKSPLAASAEEEEREKKKKKKGELDIEKKANQDGESSSSSDKPAAVRTSSCTKEEVDAILIQCGRLSRNSSGQASHETGGSYRKYSGSKRSYDFDNEKRREDEEDWEKPVSRPSPRRRTPSRERSGSRERGSGGNRRVSRSPGRRSNGPMASSGLAASDRPKPPGKMVSVPAREKRGAFAEAGKTVSTAVTNKRNASPRSRSPANTTRVSSENALHQPQSLSRSSSRKAEQSPSRRSSMAEIDDNSLRGNQNKVLKSIEGEEGVRKPSSQIQTQVRGSCSSSSLEFISFTLFCLLGF